MNIGKQGKTDLDEGEELAHAKGLWQNGAWLIQGMEGRSKWLERRVRGYRLCVETRG